MFGWKQLGPSWLTNDVFRVLEVLNEQHIPSRMPLGDMFVFNLFRPAHPALRWEIRVRQRDWDRAIDLLHGEELLNRSMSGKGAPESRRRPSALFNIICNKRRHVTHFLLK